MKSDYIIWLDTGTCIEGTAGSNDIDALIAAWREGASGIFLLQDDDGHLYLEIRHIVCIAKNKTTKKHVGYSQPMI